MLSEHCPSQGKSLTVEAPAINRINSSQEHSSGRTHQFHYLSWTEAILSPCHCQSAPSMEPTKPIVQTHNMHQLSNALYQSLSASNIHLAGKPHLNLLKKNKNVQIFNPFSFYWVGKCELRWTREFLVHFSLHTNPVQGHSKNKCFFLSCPYCWINMKSSINTQ